MTVTKTWSSSLAAACVDVRNPGSKLLSVLQSAVAVAKPIDACSHIPQSFMSTSMAAAKSPDFVHRVSTLAAAMCSHPRSRAVTAAWVRHTCLYPFNDQQAD